MTPTLYRPNLPRVGTECLICGATQRLINDHCHAHGWVRGALCAP
ncbi:endonuclease domain-containing protein, partial [Streptomyces sp. NPDC055055]